jgi:hypothetical protein
MKQIFYTLFLYLLTFSQDKGLIFAKNKKFVPTKVNPEEYSKKKLEEIKNLESKF